MLDFDDMDETVVLDQYKKWKKRNRPINGAHAREKDVRMDYEHIGRQMITEPDELIYVQPTLPFGMPRQSLTKVE